MIGNESLQSFIHFNFQQFFSINPDDSVWVQIFSNFGENEICILGYKITPNGVNAVWTWIPTGYWSKMTEMQILSIIAPKSENRKSAF